jgi:hypothetical protein
MNVDAELRAYTLGGAAVTALVGQRMHARMLPQTPTLPAIVYQRIDTRRLHDMNGPDGLPRARVQVTSCAATVAAAWDVANAVRARLDGYQGAWGTVTVQSCLCVGERDLDDPETGRIGVAQDYMIQYTEV